ncbi:hypothetical protein [Streptomyces sp. x-19]|uniref:hypothetical protein n=1 Tax=Streptomyces sp. x-19 TaxID=2789280 RepID=UPI0039807725
MLDIAARVADVRATYGPDENAALNVYDDALKAFEDAGLHPYAETRGGLAICAHAPNGTLLVVACQDFLPLNRDMLLGWHLTHVPEDEPAPAWRCVVYDTTPADLRCDPAGNLSLEPLVDAALSHLSACAHTAKGGQAR